MTTKTKTVNLYDVLPLHKPSGSRNKEKNEIITRHDEMNGKVANAYDALHAFGLRQSTISSQLSNLSPISNEFQKINEIRGKFLREYGYLPPSMINGVHLDQNTISLDNSDAIASIAQSPKILGSDVKSITDKFSFLCIPVECLNEKSYERENYYTREAIRNFIKWNSKNDFNVYVISPVEYYSLQNHVHNNTTEKPLYLGNHALNIGAALINIPMFRGILNSINKLDTRVSNLENESSIIKTSIQQMENTIISLQKQVDKQQKELVLQKMQIENQKKEMELFKEMSLRIIDPVLIAFDKNIDITSDEFEDTICFVGPCWGPDFSLEVSMALGASVVKNQRNTLTNSMQQLWN